MAGYKEPGFNDRIAAAAAAREKALAKLKSKPAPDPAAQWVAFGAGEERVYLNTPRWRDIRPGTVWSALTGGKRVMHVEWVRDPRYAAREIRLRPEEYRRLWAAVRADFALDRAGKPTHIDHPGYGPADTFYWARDKASAIHTCNSWVAQKLRLAGVRNGPMQKLLSMLTPESR